jgi:hypothetical protein
LVAFAARKSNQALSVRAMYGARSNALMMVGATWTKPQTPAEGTVFRGEFWRQNFGDRGRFQGFARPRVAQSGSANVAGVLPYLRQAREEGYRPGARVTFETGSMGDTFSR